MAEKSGFFNAIRIDGDYDRKYNADDYTDNLAVVISNGVLRSENDDLKVTASGMIPKVNAGRAWINGHYYYNTALFSFAAVTAPISGSRYDRIMLRMNKNLSERKVSLVYVQGTAANEPVKPAPTRTESIYELVLADIFVTANATSITVTDARADRDLCGWVYSTAGDSSFFTTLDDAFQNWFEGVRDELSSVTLFKRYKWTETLSAATNTVAFNIPQYDAETCFIEVYVNGILDNRYTLNNNIITFAGLLVGGTVVTVNCYKSIDGTGIESVADEITELQNAVAALDGVAKFTYKCTGLNDNISLSDIAQAFLNGSYVASSVTSAANAFLTAIGGNTYLAGLTAEAQITVDVVGRAGVTTPYAGSGTDVSRYRYFAFGGAGTNSKKIIFDFAKCEKLTIACAANTNNIIFYGTDINIKNANVYAYSNYENCKIVMIAGSANSGLINVDDCRFSVSTSGEAKIAENGDFTNCYCVTKSSAGNSICFDAKNLSLIRLHGGTFYAYAKLTASRAAVMNIDVGEAQAVIMAVNINCPTVAATGYYQRHLAIANSGNLYVRGVCSTMDSTGTAADVVGQIWKSKR